MKRAGLIVLSLFLMSGYQVGAAPWYDPFEILVKPTNTPTPTLTPTPTNKILLQIVPSIKMEIMPLTTATASPTTEPTATTTSVPSLTPTESPTTAPLTPTEGSTIAPTVTVGPTPTVEMVEEVGEEDKIEEEKDGLISLSFSLQEAIIAGLVLAVVALGWSKFKGKKKNI